MSGHPTAPSPWQQSLKTLKRSQQPQEEAGVEVQPEAEEIAVTGEAVTEEAAPEPREAANKTRARIGIRTEVPGTRTSPRSAPAGSIGSMARELGFVLIDTTAHGETTRAQGRGTTETSLQELKL